MANFLDKIKLVNYKNKVFNWVINFMSIEDFSWSERERLRFIERMLYWRGTINRKDLIEAFGISPPQATNDLVHYTTRNSGACFYNVRSKRYEAAEDMEPILVEPDFGIDLAKLGVAVWPEEAVAFVAEPELPLRKADRAVMRALVRAAHLRQSLEVRYWSVHSGRAEWRRVSPRAFAHDGLRWHVRAYCVVNSDFRDFVPGRITRIRNPQECPEANRVDEDWAMWVTLLIRPNPQLSQSRRKALEMDYGMRGGELRLRVRKALVLYTARRLGFISQEARGSLPVLNETEQLEWVYIKAAGKYM